MKKLLAIILMATVLLSGCGKQLAITAEAKEYGYFNFDNLEWGMTSAEVMKKLGKKESDFTVKEDTPPNMEVVFTIFTLENTKYQEKNATIEYHFWGIPNASEKQALYNVSVTFVDDLTDEAAKAVWEKVTKEIASYEIELAKDVFPSTGDYSCISKAESRELPEELQDKANAYARKLLYDSNAVGQSSMIKDIDSYQYTISSNQPLSSAKMNLRQTSKEEAVYHIFFKSEVGKLKLFARLAEAEGVQ